MRASAVLSSVVVVLALSTSCGSPSEDPARSPASRGPSTEQQPPTGSPSSSSGAPGAGVQAREPSGAYDLVLEDVSVVSHDGHDRIVLSFAGTGTPGWAVRFVDEPVLEGSGTPVDLEGDAVLQVDISGTPTLTPGSSRPVADELSGDVVDLRASAAYEGITQVFLGLRGGRTPFRVSTLAAPSRLVVEVE